MKIAEVKDRATAAVEQVRDAAVEAAVRIREGEILDQLRRLKVDPPSWSLKQLLVLVLVIAVLGFGIYWLSYDRGWDARGAAFEQERREMTEKVTRENEQLVRELKAEIAELKRQIAGEIANAASLDSEKLRRIAGYQAKATSCGWVPETIKELNN
jgi:uncharacterized protein HemX